jgi:hypothetical protein
LPATIVSTCTTSSLVGIAPSSGQIPFGVGVDKNKDAVAAVPLKVHAVSILFDCSVCTSPKPFQDLELSQATGLYTGMILRKNKVLDLSGFMEVCQRRTAS